MTVIIQQEEIVVLPQGMFYRRIREATLAIDNELITAEDARYREILVKAAYTLRNLEEHSQKGLG